ncbi:hypothetical protein QYF36_022619 [Acer negundo]|nr:hypothetical protein QYF36_022619 [Acer negundo]
MSTAKPHILLYPFPDSGHIIPLLDLTRGWTHQLAYQVGVQRVVFSPSGAIGLSLFFTLWKDLPKVDDPSDIKSLLPIPNFPNCHVLPWYQVPQLYRMFKEGDPDWEFQRNGSLDNIASWGIVLSTSTCLEQVYIDHIKKQVGHGRVWAVGPVLPTHSAGPTAQCHVTS